MDKRMTALVLNLLALFIAFGGMVVITVSAPQSESFSLQRNIIGLVLALIVIAAGVLYYSQVSKSKTRRA